MFRDKILHVQVLHCVYVSMQLPGSTLHAEPWLFTSGSQFAVAGGLKVVDVVPSAMHRWIHRGADHEAPQASAAAADSETVSTPRSSTISSASFGGECSTSRTAAPTEAALHCPTASPQLEQSLQPAGSVTGYSHSAEEELQCSAPVQPQPCSSAAADYRSSDSACSNDSRTGPAHSSACKARNSTGYAASEAAATKIHKLFREASVLVGMHPDQVGLHFWPPPTQQGCKHILSLALA